MIRSLKDDLAYILHDVGTISATSVDIALSGTLSISQMATQVVLADNAGLAGTLHGCCWCYVRVSWVTFTSAASMLTIPGYCS